MRRARLAFALTALLSATTADAACRQALALGLDVSGSVDAREYRLQMEGLAHALDLSEVRGALLSMPRAPISMMVYEWSGIKDTFVVVPWTTVDTDATIDNVIATLRTTERREANPGTALGLAMESGVAYLAMKPDCWKHTLDISGDGKSNLGPRPRDVRQRLAASDVTINGLVIGADAPALGDLRQMQVGELVAYYEADVIFGTDAFVETALGYEDYARAMARKLMREIETLSLSRREPDTPLTPRATQISRYTESDPSNSVRRASRNR